LLKAHGGPINWKNMSSSYPKDAVGKRVLMQYYLLEAQKYSGAFVTMMQPARGTSSSAATPPSTGTPPRAPEVP
jgi:hypothetical protein